jgi:ribosomal protein S18 acetylase RimI-like enzyme
MAVAEQVRRRGIGRALTYTAIKKARAEGAKKIFLESFRPTLNAGIELYRSCGFKESIPAGYKFSYKHRANVYMELELPRG